MCGGQSTSPKLPSAIFAMVDITDRATRSRMMSGIRGRNTRPERSVRSALHRRGLRFRLHVKALPGKPDIVLPKYNAVVFTHGCFWHAHGCKYSKMPSTRPAFWRRKFDENTSRDRRFIEALLASGWRVAVVWECSIRIADRSPKSRVYDKLEAWVRAKRSRLAKF